MKANVASTMEGNLSTFGGLALVPDVVPQCRWPHRWLIFIPQGLEKSLVWKLLFLPD